MRSFSPPRGGASATSEARPLRAVRVAAAFPSASLPLAATLPQCDGLTASTSHGAAGKGASTRVWASQGLGVATYGRAGAAGGSRVAGGGPGEQRGGQRERQRTVGAAGGARGAQARVRPLQVSAGRGQEL